MEKYIEEFETSRLVIYTVIIDGYDTLKEPEFLDENCDYVCFTNDKKLTSEIWQTRLIEDTHIDNTRLQRMYKILPHRFLSEYEYSIYIDGNVRIIGSFRDFVKKEWRGASLLGLKHPSRDNVYDEAEACINFNKDDPEIIRKQIEKYKSEGYMADNGLTVNNIIFRKNNDQQLIKVMEDWWEEIQNNSRRDQLSFCYVCWKNHFKYDVSELKCYRSDYWLNPGIHTDNIRDVEKELIDHIQQVDYYQYLIKEKELYISLKEQEYKEAIFLKEQMHESVLAQKEQEKIEALALKKEEYENALALKEKEKTLAMKKEEYENALALKESEKEEALALKESEKEEALALKESELGQVITVNEHKMEQMNQELEIKSQEIAELQAHQKHMENTLSWRYTAIFRKIFVKRK